MRAQTPSLPLLSRSSPRRLFISLFSWRHVIKFVRAMFVTAAFVRFCSYWTLVTLPSLTSASYLPATVPSSVLILSAAEASGDACRAATLASFWALALSFLMASAKAPVPWTVTFAVSSFCFMVSLLSREAVFTVRDSPSTFPAMTVLAPSPRSTTPSCPRIPLTKESPVTFQAAPSFRVRLKPVTSP